MTLGLMNIDLQALPRIVLDSMPIPVFIVDADVRIQDFNTAASHWLGPHPQLALHQRGGEAMHCINSEAKGCGRGAPCKNCVIRNSVNKAVKGGDTHRLVHNAELRSAGKTTAIDLLVTTSPLPGTEPKSVLLILEDVTELATLRGLLPICSRCKKVRDDDQYWHEIDTYLHSHMHLEFTHGLCPSCFAGQMKIIENLKAQ